jgi:hypothetical protein
METTIVRDRELLEALGKTTSYEFASFEGCSRQSAKNRLRRLYERGLAVRYLERGAWTYAPCHNL